MVGVIPRCLRNYKNKRHTIFSATIFSYGAESLEARVIISFCKGDALSTYSNPRISS